jgi:hypothetical protein
MFWHAVLALVGAAIWGGWRPAPRAAIALSLPAFSVGTLAALSGNPFNAVAFFALGLGIAAVGSTLRAARISAPSRIERAIGLGLVAFGWIYPHFLESDSPWLYLVAAPLGTIPCPTLSALCGVTVLADGFSSRLWRLVLGAVALFYGTFGVVRLHVYIDAVLILGAFVVLWPALARSRAQRDLGATGQSGRARSTAA